MTTHIAAQYFDSSKIAALVNKVNPQDDYYIAKMYAAVETIILHGAFRSGLSKPDFITFLLEDTTSPAWDKLLENLSLGREESRERVYAAKEQVEIYADAISRLNTCLENVEKFDRILLRNYLGKAASDLTHLGIPVPISF